MTTSTRPGATRRACQRDVVDDLAQPVRAPLRFRGVEPRAPGRALLLPNLPTTSRTAMYGAAASISCTSIPGSTPFDERRPQRRIEVQDRLVAQRRMDRPQSGHHDLPAALAVGGRKPAVVLGRAGDELGHRLPELDEHVGARVYPGLCDAARALGPRRHARDGARVAQPPLLERGRQPAARLVEADGEQARARDRSALGEGLDRPNAQVVQIGDGIIATRDQVSGRGAPWQSPLRRSPVARGWRCSSDPRRSRSPRSIRPRPRSR